MTASISDLAGFRFTRRLEKSRKKLEELVSTTQGATQSLSSINDQLRMNVENQRILNSYLASRTKPVVAPAPKKLALVVSNDEVSHVIPNS